MRSNFTEPCAPSCASFVTNSVLRLLGSGVEAGAEAAESLVLGLLGFYGDEQVIEICGLSGESLVVRLHCHVLGLAV